MIFWLVLSFLIINEGLEGFHIPELFTYLSATSLAFLHIYNLKYCSCEDEECCVQKKLFAYKPSFPKRYDLLDSTMRKPVKNPIDSYLQIMVL